MSALYPLIQHSYNIVFYMDNPEAKQHFQNEGHESPYNCVCSPSPTLISNLNENQHMFFEKDGIGQEATEVIQKINPYKLAHKDYIGVKIKPLHRYKLIKWIQYQSQRQKYTRQVLALSSYYLDLFLSKIEKQNLDDLQDIALASILVAIKMEGGLFPKLEKEFSKNKILMLEVKICLKLNYFLNPTTYLKHLDDYTMSWNSFTLKLGSQYQQSAFSEKQFKGSIRIKNLYEKIQYINMISESLKYDLGQLCFNLFFIQTMLHLKALESKDPKSIEDMKKDRKLYENWLNSLYLSFDMNQNIFNEFLRYEGNGLRFPALKKQVGFYLLPFLMIKGDNKMNICPYNRMLQTYNVTALKKLDTLAKEMLSNN